MYQLQAAKKASALHVDRLKREDEQDKKAKRDSIAKRIEKDYAEGSKNNTIHSGGFGFKAKKNATLASFDLKKLAALGQLPS